MNTNDQPIDIIGWLNEQVKTVNQAIADLEKNHNYGKATLCEGMREAYMKCLEKIQDAAWVRPFLLYIKAFHLMQMVFNAPK